MIYVQCNSLNYIALTPGHFLHYIYPLPKICPAMWVSGTHLHFLVGTISWIILPLFKGISYIIWTSYLKSALHFDFLRYMCTFLYILVNTIPWMILFLCQGISYIMWPPYLKSAQQLILSASLRVCCQKFSLQFPGYCFLHYFLRWFWIGCLFFSRVSQN